MPDNEDESKRLRDNTGMELRPQHARHENLAPRGMAPSFNAGSAQNLRPDAVDRAAVSPPNRPPNNPSGEHTQSPEKGEKGTLHFYRTGDERVDTIYGETHVMVEDRDKSDGHGR